MRNICATIQLVVVARQDTIAKLERAADYLDSVWLRCRVLLKAQQLIGIWCFEYIKIQLTTNLYTF